MKRGAILALVTWRLLLAEPIREIQSFSLNADAISNIELLVPLLVSERGALSERYERAQQSDDNDRAIRDIPTHAFKLDNDDFVPEQPKRGSRKPQPAHRPRSLYLDSAEFKEHGEQEESDEQAKRAKRVDLWRVCERYARQRLGAAREVLLYLCAELLDTPPPTSTPPPPPSPTQSSWASHEAQCEFCRETLALLGYKAARRDFMPIGDNADMVHKYIHMPRKHASTG